MNFYEGLSTQSRIELLERWILVQSFIYYELNSNIASDFVYDHNVNLLFDLKRNDPESYEASRYYKIFDEYEEGCTSGFELLDKLKRLDYGMYLKVEHDAQWALDIFERQK